MIGDKHSRRSFIRTSATAFAAPIGIVGVTSAQQRKTDISKFKQLIERGQKIQQKRDVESKLEFLKMNDIAVETVSNEYSMTEKNDSLSKLNSPLECVTGRNCDSDLRVTLTISRKRTSFVYNVELAFQHKFKMWDLYTRHWIGGQDPADGCGLTWNGDAWDLYDDTNIDETTSTTEYVEFNDGSYADGDANRRGYIGFEIKDKDWTLSHDPENAWANSERDAPDQWSDTQSASVYLTLGSNTDRSSEIHGSYAHTWYESRWQSGDLNGIGYSEGGTINLKFDNTTGLQTVTTQTEEDGSSLLVIDRGDTSTYP